MYIAIQEGGGGGRANIPSPLWFSIEFARKLFRKHLVNLDFNLVSLFYHIFVKQKLFSTFFRQTIIKIIVSTLVVDILGDSRDIF